MSPATSLARRIWRDNAVRSLPVWLLITAALVNALAAVIVLAAARRGAPEVPAYQVILTMWLPLGVYLLFSRTRNRCHPLEMALPISARELWTSHSIAVLAAGMSVLAAAAAVIAGAGRLLSRLPNGPDTGLEILRLLPPSAAGLLLAVLLVQRLQPGSWRLAGSRRYWTVLAAGLAVIPLCLILLSSWPWIATALFLLPAGVLAVRTRSSLPTAFELAPELVAERDDAAGARPEAAADPAATARVSRLLFQVLHNAPPWRRALPLVLYSIEALMGFSVSGVLELWVDMNDSRAINLPLGTYMLFAGAGLLTHNLHRLDPLPVSRRTLFRVLTLPALVMFCLGWAAGRLLIAAAGVPAEGPETPVYLAIVLVPWLLLMALFARSLRATSSERFIRWVYWGCLLGLLAILIGQFVLAMTGVYEPAAAEGFLEDLVRRLGSRPLAALASWGASLAAIALAYLLAQAQFRRAELPTSPIQCALVDWGRDD